MTQLGEYFKMAFKNIWGNKGRTLLTMLGIIIGISSVILVVSVGGGATELIAGELGDLGSGQIAFQVLKDEDKYLLDRDDLSAVRQLDGVKAVTKQDFFSGGSLSTRKYDFTVEVAALDAEGFDFLERDREVSLAQPPGLEPEHIGNGHDGRQHLPENRCNCGASDAHIQREKEEIVQHKVQCHTRK